MKKLYAVFILLPLIIVLALIFFAGGSSPQLNPNLTDADIPYITNTRP